MLVSRGWPFGVGGFTPVVGRRGFRGRRTLGMEGWAGFGSLGQRPPEGFGPRLGRVLVLTGRVLVFTGRIFGPHGPGPREGI